MLKILFVSSEVAPYSKTGGLADVSGALPLALARRGCDVRVVTPRYGSIDPERFGLVADETLPAVSVEVRGRPVGATFRRCPAASNHPQVYFVECPPLYDRPGVYSDPATGRDYIDNDYRYILLCRAALELARVLDWEPDILHGNDWQSGPMPLYLHQARASGWLRQTRALTTIHNIAYLGRFGPQTVGRIGGAERYFFEGGPLEFHGDVSFLKMGLAFSDALNTVSPTYAREIQSGPEYGYGMETVLRLRGDGVAGILNGIDVDAWNPETDPHIAAHYSREQLDAKEENKRALCQQVGLPYEAGVPLVGLISRLTSQKGFEILEPVLPAIMELPARVVMLGSGEAHYERAFANLAKRHPERMYLRLGYDDPLSHQIEAGADLFLMPSKYEPCGLNQMMSMRYGTLPVVRATGGLADTVTDADANPAAGTGFSFAEYAPEALLGAVRRAVAAFRDRPRWRQLQRTAMSRDFSWDHSAGLYIELYRACLRRPPRELD